MKHALARSLPVSDIHGHTNDRQNRLHNRLRRNHAVQLPNMIQKDDSRNKQHRISQNRDCQRFYCLSQRLKITRHHIDHTFYHPSGSIYAEAAERLTCIVCSIEKHREALLSNSRFLALICNSLSAKIGTMAAIDAAPASLTERVISYMKYKCHDQTLKGIEQAAFHLHCSARQLQRILNRSEAAGFVIKLGKGTYKLVEDSECFKK